MNDTIGDGLLGGSANGSSGAEMGGLLSMAGVVTR
jgi:hypothetical protein